uniref:Uncharacterized protein LOC105038289 n=1 Tax=Elaeis guineensis var. tenera TaxID=51953 RepID=A0A6J0PG62_ELAGV|nr:uncharacterized protein LOC105038289 [Elaeis guineensis]
MVLDGLGYTDFYCFGIETGKILCRRAAMRRNNGKSPKLELKLNLSLRTTSRRLGAEEEESLASLSPPSSCVSSGSNSPEATTMVLAGCTRCLMYVMLSQEDPKCPKCKNAVLLDFLRAATTTTTDGGNNNISKKIRKT